MTEGRLTLFYDGACPLCLREVNFLRRRDRNGKIAFLDIAAPEFRAEEHGFTYAALMERIYARLPDGSVITGVEVFRQLYARVGFGWLVPVTRIVGIRHLLDVFYEVWAKNRLRLTGRCAAEACALPERS